MNGPSTAWYFGEVTLPGSGAPDPAAASGADPGVVCAVFRTLARLVHVQISLVRRCPDAAAQGCTQYFPGRTGRQVFASRDLFSLCHASDSPLVGIGAEAGMPRRNIPRAGNRAGAEAGTPRRNIPRVGAKRPRPSAPFGANHPPLTVRIVTADTCCRLKTLRWVPEKLFAESREAPQPNVVHDWRWGGPVTGQPRGRDR